MKFPPIRLRLRFCGSFCNFSFCWVNKVVLDISQFKRASTEKPDMKIEF